MYFPLAAVKRGLGGLTLLKRNLYSAAKRDLLEAKNLTDGYVIRRLEVSEIGGCCL